MKHFLSCVLSIICNYLPGAAQPAWREIKSDATNGYFASTINCMGRDLQGFTIYAGCSSGLLKFDGSSWSPVGDIPTNNGMKSVTCYCTDDAGNLYVSGSFTNAAGKYYIAKWNGSAWSECGNSPLTSSPSVIACDHAGNIYAGGFFTNAAGKYYVAKFNGLTWSELGNLAANSSIWSIYADAANNIYAGGNFTNASGKKYVAKWDGSSWNEVGALNANGIIKVINGDASGNLFAGGSFTNASSKYYISKWNGSTWAELGSGGTALNVGFGNIQTFILDGAGNIYAAGFHTSGRYWVAKWNGAAWSEAGGSGSLTTNNVINGLAIDAAGKVYAGGAFYKPGNTSQKYVASLAPASASWKASGTGVSGQLASPGLIASIAFDRAGNVYAAAAPSDSVGIAIKKWNGKVWQDLRSATSFLYSTGIGSLWFDKSDNLYACANFEMNNIPKMGVVKWDGMSWSQLGTSDLFNDMPTGLAGDSSGNLYARGLFTGADGKPFIAKWNGAIWSVLGNGSFIFQEITGMTADPAGNVYAAVYESVADLGYVMKWNGTNWVLLPGLDNQAPISCMTLDKAGNLYVSTGSFVPKIKKWNGSAWSVVGPTNFFINQPDYLATDNFGDLYAAEPNGTTQKTIRKWNGTAWIPVGLNPFYPNEIISAISFDKYNTLYTGGRFYHPGTQAPYVMAYTTVAELCPPSSSFGLQADLTGTTYQWQENTGTGFTNLFDNNMFTGTTSSALQVINLPSSAAGTMYRCMVNGKPGTVITARFVDRWRENAGAAWDNPLSWSCGTVPDQYTDVIFYSGSALVSSSTAVSTLTLLGGSPAVTVAPGVLLTVVHP